MGGRKNTNKRGSSELYGLLKGLSKTEILKLSTKTCTHGHSLIAHPACLRQYLGQKEKVGYFDIESSGLKANFAKIYSYCIKLEGENKILGRAITKKELLSDTSDSKLIREMCEDLSKFDRICTYYGTGFDIPFVRARALHYGIDFPVYQEVKHTDVYYMVKNRLKLSRSGLATACDFLHISSKSHPLMWDIWDKAGRGDTKALQWIFDHNKEDVVSTELLHKKLDKYVGINGRSI